MESTNANTCSRRVKLGGSWRYVAPGRQTVQSSVPDVTLGLHPVSAQKIQHQQWQAFGSGHVERHVEIYSSIAVQPDDQQVAARISACLMKISDFHLDDLYLQLHLAKTEVLMVSATHPLCYNRSVQQLKANSHSTDNSQQTPTNSSVGVCWFGVIPLLAFVGVGRSLFSPD